MTVMTLKSVFMQMMMVHSHELQGHITITQVLLLFLAVLMKLSFQYYMLITQFSNILWQWQYVIC